MTIQLNTDKNLSIHEAFGTKLDDMLKKALSRYSEHITRLEVHLSDENGGKNGQLDKKCMIEARLEGKPPIAVTANANTHEQSVAEAIEKIKHSLDSIIGKLKNY